MNITQIDTLKPRKRRPGKPFTVADDAPPVAYLRCYRSMWVKEPLWLVGLTATDPRRDPRQALKEAFDMLAAADAIRVKPLEQVRAAA